MNSWANDKLVVRFGDFTFPTKTKLRIDIESMHAPPNTKQLADKFTASIMTNRNDGDCDPETINASDTSDTEKTELLNVPPELFIE